MTCCVIKLDDRYLFLELPVTDALELAVDLVTRYEQLFTFAEPSYPEGKADLIFRVLHDGYGLPLCHSSVGIEILDLRVIDIQPQTTPNPKWKELHAGRLLAGAFAETINQN